MGRQTAHAVPFPSRGNYAVPVPTPISFSSGWLLSVSSRGLVAIGRLEVEKSFSRGPETRSLKGAIPQPEAGELRDSAPQLWVSLGAHKEEAVARMDGFLRGTHRRKTFGGTGDRGDALARNDG